MGDSTPFPEPAAIARAELFTREQFVYDGETLEDGLSPGSARRRALDAALTEMDAGATTPSIEWRRQFSLLLGLERLLSEEEPHLADGTVLSAHQVDALSGTLTALLAEAQRNGNGSNGASPASAPPEPVPLASATLPEDEDSENGSDEDLDDGDAEDEEPQDWQDEGELDEDVQLEEAPEDPNADRRFWFEHATGAGKTVAALGFVEASRTGGVLILTHRRNLVDQFNGELRDRGYRNRITAPLLGAKDNPNGPVTVETYQWFVRNAGKISDAYTIVICDEAHTALGEKTSARDPRLVGTGVHRHDRDRRADRPPRHRPVPDADLALRPGAGRSPRGDLAAAVHPHPARAGRAHDRQGAAAARRGGHRVRPGDAGRAARPDARSTWRSPTSTRPASTACPASSTPPASATPTTSPRRSRTWG